MGGKDNVKKNKAKRTHARCGDKEKVRESGERERREREIVGGGGGGGGWGEKG